MLASPVKSAYWKGLSDGAPFVLVAGPFAALFGVLGTEAGLNLFEVMMFSFSVVAGAAQFTALQLLQEEAPTLIVLISALAVNLRVAMYSAAITPYLGDAPLWKRAIASYILVDQSYGLSQGEFERVPTMTVSERHGYYFGSCTLVLIAWFGCSFLGAALGTALPQDFPLDFALPIAFLSIVGPMIRTLPHLVAAIVAIIVGLFAVAVPFSLGLIIAGACGMSAGAYTELVLKRRGDA